MPLSRGKRRRRQRRSSGWATEPVEEAPPSQPARKSARSGRRTPKPLSERSPLVPAVFAGICVLGAVFTVEAYKGAGGLIFAAFYLALAAVEGFIAYRIYRARGGTWR